MSDSKSSRQDSLDACLGLAFGTEQDATGEMANKSVLQSLGHLMKTVPQVLLRDIGDGAAVEPCVMPDAAQKSTTLSTSRYRIDGQIAEGGMGKILKGRDTDLGRDLAVKVLLDKHVDKPEVIQRFVEEAQIGGQLQHPGIAPVYELGQFEDQRPFFTMKLVKGKTLAELLESRADVESDRAHYLGIFEQICQTMAYAHSRGVIHRDLKPANIMVGAFGEVQVMDWGLAKVLSAGGVADEKKAHQTHQDRSIIETLRSAGSNTPAEFGSQTQMGSVMGTPAYMPPEQALGEIDRLDQRADVFGLGAILCEILTGKPPYVGADHVQVYRLATRGKLDQCFQRIDDADVDAELAKVLKECLAAEPIDRPRNANVLATRISQYRAGVESRLRRSEIDHAAETARADEERKRRRISMALAASILALVTALTGSGVWIQTQKAIAAESQRQESENQKEELRWVLYQSDLQRAQLEIDRGNYETAREVLLEHVPEGDQDDFRSFEWHYLLRQCPIAIRDASSKWDDDIVSWLQSGKRLDRSDADKSRTASFDETSKQLVVWNARTGKRIWSKQLDLPVEYPKFRLDADGQLLAFVTASVGEGHDLNSASTELHIWDIDADQQVATVTSSDIPEMKEKTATVEFRPNSNEIAIIIKDKSYLGANKRFSRNLYLWNFENNTLLFETYLERPHFGFDGFSFSPDGSLIAVPSRPGRENFDRKAKTQRDAVGVVHLIDAESGENVRDLFAIPYRFGHKPTFSDDGSRLAMSCTNHSQFFNKSYEKDDALLIWEVATGTLMTVASTTCSRSEIEFNATGELVLLGSEQSGSNTEVFQVSDGSLAFRVENKFGNPIRFSDDDQFLETRDHEGVRWRWSVPRAPFNHSERIPYGNVALSGDGKRFLKQSWIGEDRETAHIFSTRGPLLQSTKIPWNQMWHPKNLNHDGSILALEHWEREAEPQILRISLWDIENRKPIGPVFSSNEREQRKHPALWRMSPTDSKVMGIISITTDDEASPTRDQLRIWDQRTLAEQRIELDGEVTTVKYSVDGKWIGVFTIPWNDGGKPETDDAVQSKTEHGTLTLFDANDGSIVKTMKVAGRFSALAISPDGQYFVGMNEGLAQHRIEVWDLESQAIHSTMDGTSNQILFSPDGKRVISKQVTRESGQNILELVVWDMNSGQQLLSIPNYGTGAEAWTTMSFLPGQHRIFDRSLRGPPHIWDGTPIDLRQQ